MKILSASVIPLAIILAFACNGEKKSNAYYETTSQFSGFINDLNKKFTEKAAYSSIMFSYDKMLGNSIMVKTAKSIDSTRLEEWFFMSGSWQKNGDTQLDTTGCKPSDLLFRINGDFDMSKLVSMVDIAKAKVTDEKKVKDAECKSVSLVMKNKKGSANKMDGLIIHISVEKPDGSSVYNISFNSKGEFEAFLE